MISFYTFSTFQFGTNGTNNPTSSHLNPAYPNISRIIPQKLFLYHYMPNILLKYRDFFIEVEDQIAEILKVFDTQEASYQRYIRRYKAYYSLDVDNGIENSILLTAQTPDEIYERKLTKEQLYRGLNSIPKKQADRIYAHYFLGMSKSEIAKSEQVDERAVRESIERGLKNMAKFLKKVL